MSAVMSLDSAAVYLRVANIIIQLCLKLVLVIAMNSIFFILLCRGLMQQMLGCHLSSATDALMLCVFQLVILVVSVMI